MIDTFLYRLFARSTAEKRLYPPPKVDFLIRPYELADRERILRIYDQNAPRRFPKNTKFEFENYIDSLPSSFFVAESKTHGIVGCGGISGLKNNIHTLCYGLVAPEHQSKRVGTTLALARIVAAAKTPETHYSLIYAVEKSIRFYEKIGYESVGIWHSETDGREFPIGVFIYHTDTLTRIRKTLQARGHLIDHSIPIQPDEDIVPVIEETEYGFFSIKLERK